MVWVCTMALVMMAFDEISIFSAANATSRALKMGVPSDCTGNGAPVNTDSVGAISICATTSFWPARMPAPASTMGARITSNSVPPSLPRSSRPRSDTTITVSRLRSSVLTKALMRESTVGKIDSGLVKGSSAVSSTITSCSDDCSSRSTSSAEFTSASSCASEAGSSLPSYRCKNGPYKSSHWEEPTMAAPCSANDNRRKIESTPAADAAVLFVVTPCVSAGAPVANVTQLGVR